MTRFLRAALLVAALAMPAAALAQTRGLHPEYMDKNTPACSDFYRYANGAWLDTVSMPPAYNVVGAGREIFDRNQAVLYQVLEQAAKNAATEKDPTLKKVGDFYAVLMDSMRANQEGWQPIAATLKRIDGIKTKADLTREFATLALIGINAPIRFGPEPDPKQSTMNIPQLWQAGMGLPERDYYFRTDPKSDTLRQQYVATIKRMFLLVDVPVDKASSDADQVMALETALAESALTRVQMRDPQALYHKMTFKELGALAPEFDWTTYFTTLGMKQIAQPGAAIDVSIPGFTKHMAKLVDQTPLDTWKAYLKWKVINAAAPWLSQEFFDVSFAFTSKLTGQKAALPRWKRASGSVDGWMGEALGKAYVATAFPPSSKTRMNELVANLRWAMGDRISKLDWMSDATKKQAKVKLDAILQKIGYPDTWRDYSKLAIDPVATGIENLRRATEFEVRRQLAQVGKKVDRMEWGMSPPTVNAYYNPAINEIVFPAGILQPPQFDPNVDDALNYGAIGMVIGHEITHGFDDEGRQYDSVGNLKDWWTAEDAAKFKARADNVVAQYNAYIGVDTLHVNGALTLGENIGDIGGLTIAYHAWKHSLVGKPAPKSEQGFTPEQRFFLSFAQAWRRKVRPEALRTQILSDPHSPAQWRVNGAVSNMIEFQQAFGCKAGDGMVNAEDKRGAIW